jgi:hypothetical protein
MSRMGNRTGNLSSGDEALGCAAARVGQRPAARGAGA